jgi:hypothetical protein
METKINEIASGIYRLSTYVPDIAPPAGFTFNQFLVLGDEPLIFHTGLRKMFPLNREALSRVIAPERLRWIAFGHFEADECGVMTEWLAISPRATPAQGQIGCMVSLNDFADRTPRSLLDGIRFFLGFRDERLSRTNSKRISLSNDSGQRYLRASIRSDCVSPFLARLRDADGNRGCLFIWENRK